MNNLISTFLLIASVGIFFGYINPTYSAVTGNAALEDRSVQELQDERLRYEEALGKTREIEEVRKGLLAIYNAIPVVDRENLEKLLPDHIDSVRLIIDVNNIASQYSMTLKNISLTEVGAASASAKTLAIGPEEDQFKSVGLKFGVSGSYDAFRSFVRDLERSLRLVDIDTVSFNAQEDSYEYAVTISTYRLK